MLQNFDHRVIGAGEHPPASRVIRVFQGHYSQLVAGFHNQLAVDDVDVVHDSGLRLIRCFDFDKKLIAVMESDESNWYVDEQGESAAKEGAATRYWQQEEEGTETSHTDEKNHCLNKHLRKNIHNQFSVR